MRLLSQILCPRVMPSTVFPSLSGHGGVAIIHRDSLQSKATEMQSFRIFECIDRLLTFKTVTINFIVITTLCKNKFTVSEFIDEFGKYIECVFISSNRIVICGNFNFHMDSLMTMI